MTFSIAARSADGRMFGVAISSSSPAVAARCAHARAGVGAVASQNITDPMLGKVALDALQRGLSAQATLAHAVIGNPFSTYRQLLVVGAYGTPAIHSGAKALGIVASALGEESAAAGNLLANKEVPQAMINAFAKAKGHLGERLLQALAAGQQQGGEAGPVHSAGLLVMGEPHWPIVDLRVDWSEANPIAELRTIWTLYEPQIDAYVQRAVNPAAAPSFGVPGDT